MITSNIVINSRYELAMLLNHVNILLDNNERWIIRIDSDKRMSTLLITNTNDRFYVEYIGNPPHNVTHKYVRTPYNESFSTFSWYDITMLYEVLVTGGPIDEMRYHFALCYDTDGNKTVSLACTRNDSIVYEEILGFGCYGDEPTDIFKEIEFPLNNVSINTAVKIINDVILYNDKYSNTTAACALCDIYGGPNVNE